MPVFDPGVPWLRGTATLTNGSTTVETDGIITLNEILEGDRLYVMDGGERIGPLEIVGGEGDEIELREPFEGATGSYPIIIDRNPITRTGAKILRDMSDVLGRIGNFGELSERDQIAADLIPIGPERDAIKDALDVTKRASNLSDLTNLKEARANLGTFSTVAEVQSRHIPPVLDSIRTNGYYAPGDGGAALYKRVASEPSHAGKIQSADGAWWEIAEESPTPLQFGAKGDGVNDDTNACNACLDWYRLKPDGGGGLFNRGAASVNIKFPPAVYSVSSVNFTGFSRAHIDLRGAIFVANSGAAGKAVLDFLTTNSTMVLGGLVYASESVGARVGWQIGRKSSTTTAAMNCFHHPVSQGFYTLAGWHNYASEGTTVIRGILGNMDNSTTSYAAIQDGGGAGFGLVSDYVTVEDNNTTSSNEQTFIGTAVSQWRGGGAALHIGRAARHTYQGVYIIATNDSVSGAVEGWAVDIHDASWGLALHIHAERFPKHLIRFVGNGKHTSRDLIVNEHVSQVTGHILAAGSGVTEVSLPNLDLTVSSVHPGAGACRAFLNPELFSAPGDSRIKFSSANPTNISTMARLDGALVISDKTGPDLDGRTTTPPTKGHYVFTGLASGEGNSPELIASDDFSWTPEFSFENAGDLSVDYTVQHARYVRMGSLCHVTISLTFSPTFSSATGAARIVGLPFSARAGVAGLSHLQVSSLSGNFPFAPDSIQIFGRITGGTQYVTLVNIVPGNATSGSALEAADFTSGANYQISISGFYQIG